MATPPRPDSAQLALRMTPEVRDRIRSAVPHGQLNGLVVDFLLRYAAEVEASRQPLEEGSTAA